ncbi:MAG: hypothetical protein ACOZF0_05140 [Thermodesulfobacteriota bacterium]
MIGKILGSLYGFGTSFLFVILYIFSYIGQMKEAMIDIVMIIAFINGIFILFIYLTRYEDRFHWEPLYLSNKLVMNTCWFYFWAMFVNVAINLIILFTNQSEQMNDTYSIRNLYSIMSFMSLIIGISFTVGLRNLLPKWDRVYRFLGFLE